MSDASFCYFVAITIPAVDLGHEVVLKQRFERRVVLGHVSIRRVSNELQQVELWNRELDGLVRHAEF